MKATLFTVVFLLAACTEDIIVKCGNLTNSETTFGAIRPNSRIGQIYGLIKNNDETWQAVPIGGTLNLNIIIDQPANQYNYSLSIDFEVSGGAEYSDEVRADIESKSKSSVLVDLTNFQRSYTEDALVSILNKGDEKSKEIIGSFEANFWRKPPALPAADKIVIIIETTHVESATIAATSLDSLNSSFSYTDMGADLTVHKECKEAIRAKNLNLFAKSQTFEFDWETRVFRSATSQIPLDKIKF